MRLRICWLAFLSLALCPWTFGQVPTNSDDNLYPLYLEVQLGEPVKLSSLRPGDFTEGTLARDVYSDDRKIFPAGTQVRLTVDRLERRRTVMNDHWPWVVRAFSPRHEMVPSFKEAAISMPGGGKALLRVSLISAGRKDEIYAQTGKRRRQEDKGARISTTPPATVGDPTHSPNDPRRRTPGPLLSLEARQEGKDASIDNTASMLSASAKAITVPAGIDCKVLFLNGVSASNSHAGDVVQARLLEPVLLDSQVALPAGSMFEGTVLKAQPPRSLSRAGSLSFTFTRVTLPDGAWFPVAAALSQVELSRGSHTRIDAEGALHGDRPGLKWMLINGGVTGGIAKEVDDGTQLVIETMLAGATDASTAGTARIAGTVVSTIFMLTRHGRDVILPNFTDMDITLTRPLTLSVPVTSRLTQPNQSMH